MESGAERAIDRALAVWVDGARRRARPVLVATAALTVALAVYAALELGVNTQHTALLDDELAFWRHYNSFAEEFPILDEALLVVVDAETPGRARSATNALSARLREQEALFADVYVPGGGDFFEQRALLYLSVEELEDLTNDLAGVQPLLAELSNDSSLANLAQVLTEGIDMVREDPDVPVDLSAVFDSLSVAVDAVLDGRPRPISWTEMLLERKLPGDSSRRLIVLEPVFDYDSLLPARAAMQAVRASAAELGLDEEHGYAVRITGNVALNTEEMLLVAEQVLAMGLVSFAMIAFILWLALPSRRLVVSVLLTLLVGLVWTLGFATASVGHLNVISVAFAILFIGLGVDFGIHFCMRYAELVRASVEPAEALRATARTVGDSLVLCALTTATGFYVFVPTHYRAVGELGLIAGTGMVISLFCTLTVLPAMLTVGDTRRVGDERSGSRWVLRMLVRLSERHTRLVRWAAAALGLGALALLPRLDFDHNVIDMRDPSTESVKTFNELLEDSETSPWTIDVMVPDLETAEATALRLRELDVVERAVTLADYVPEEQEDKLVLLEDLAFFLPEISPEKVRQKEKDLAGQIAALRALRRALHSPWLHEGDPGRDESATRAEERLGIFLERLESIERKGREEALEEFEKSLTGELRADMLRLWNALDPEAITLAALPRDLARRMVSSDGKARIEVLPSEDLSAAAAHEAFVDEVRALVPQATGSAVTVLEWARAVVDAFQFALALAVLAIALLLWLLWRNLSHMTLVMVPLALAAVLTCATAVLLGIEFNFVNVVVIPLLLGIGVDSGVHLVHRFRLTLERASGPITSSELLGTSTAQAVFFSAVTTMGSFGTLAFVTHGGIRSMGLLLLIGVGYMLVCNLVVLPALIALASPARSADAGADVAS